jgi:tetratricopeptide (TPR) repeat protein/DNA-binding XRE family transcriptional regulator
VEVDPRLIRRARLDSGLSMAQLAGSEVTRQAIFLIETGKTRPSMRTLELIASRTGKPAGYFMRPADESSGGPVSNGYQVEDLEAMCLQLQFEEAIALGNRVLEQRVPARVEAYVRQYIGQAFVRSSRPDDALEHLRRANEILEAQPDPWLAVECADWEACALYLKEDKRALAVAEHALKLCRSTQPRLPGTEARILEHIATIHVKNHNFDRAIAFYEEALEAAGSVRDLARLGRTYHGLSIAYQERGDLGRAVEFTHKALALYSLEHDTALLGRGENELGLLLMRQGKMARAEEAFCAAVEHFDESGTERAKSHVLISLADLQLKTGRLKEASDTVKQAVELAVRLNERIALGDAHELLGRIYEEMGKRRLADKEFASAIRLLHGEGLEQRLAESHVAFAEVLESRGRSTLARKHWKDAANLALQREGAGARQLKAL